MSAVVAMLPTPYTADAIREAFQPGVFLAFDVTTGGATSRQRWQVTQATADEVTIAFTVQGATDVKTSAFEDLRQHAAFPADTAERERVSWDSSLGPVEGWVYTVQGETLRTFWFADAYPGPPLLMTVHNGETETMRMEQVQRGVTP